MLVLALVFWGQRILEKTLDAELPKLLTSELGIPVTLAPVRASITRLTVHTPKLVMGNVQNPALLATNVSISLEWSDLLAREMSPGPDEMVLDAEERQRMEDMLSVLDDRSADVVRRRYGLLDGRQAKLADIAQVWGITAERVRQIERHAIAKLRTTAELAA